MVSLALIYPLLNKWRAWILPGMVLAGLPVMALAQPNTGALTSQVLTMAQDREVLHGTSWSMIAQYVDSGESLIQIQPDLRLAPASTLKLITSAVALKTLGPYYRFKTNIYRSGDIDEQGVLQGDLYVQGTGDPMLGSSRVSSSMPWEILLENWATALKDKGIKKIQGNIYADTSAFSGPSLPDKVNWQNMGNYFATPISALAFNDNLFSITFGPQPKHGELLPIEKTSPQIDGLNIHSFVTADSTKPRDEAYVYASPGQYDLHIYGTLPTSKTPYPILAAQPDAPLLLVNLLKKQLQKEGIEVSGTTQVLYQAPNYSSFALLRTHFSPPLIEMIYVLNKRSFNFYADMLVPSLAIYAGQPGTTENGLQYIRKFLKNKNISTENLRIYDGCGLARDNQVTAQTLLDVLLFMTHQKEFNLYYNSLATLDERGDLMLLGRQLKKSKRIQDIHVKGGTLDGVKAQAGYVKDKKGRLIAFAFIANNLIYKDERINRFYEDVLRLLLDYKAGKSEKKK